MTLGVATTFLQLPWLLSLPTWGLMWMGQVAVYTGLRTMVGRLGHRAFLTGVVLSHCTMETRVTSPLGCEPLRVDTLPGRRPLLGP
jgi:hypothetical protein